MGQIEGTLGILRNAGAPVNGTNEVQTLTIGGTPTGGTFKLAYEGQITAAITWSAVNNTLLANIQTALRALATIGSAGVTCAAGTLTDGIGTVIITFGGNLAKLVVPNISVYSNSLTGTNPTLAVAETTPGVTATGRGAAVGALLLDTTNAKLYKNDGTALEPSWNSVGDIATAEIADGAVTQIKIEAGAAAAGLSGLVAKFVANANVIGGIPVLHRIDITAGALGDTDVVLTHKTRVIEAWLVLRGAGVATTTLQVKNVANPITDAMAASGADKAVVRCASLDDAFWEIAAGDRLRVTSATGATQPDATVYVLGIRVE
uniref:Putative tail protein n=1 Tax=viral metagenome TaxID=1070528 RepID=A0A6M3XSQ1_9ZZZZ